MPSIFDQLGVAPPVKSGGPAPAPTAGGTDIFSALGVARPKVEEPVPSAPIAVDDTASPIPEPSRAINTQKQNPILDEIVRQSGPSTALLAAAVNPEQSLGKTMLEHPLELPKAAGRGIIETFVASPAELVGLGANIVGAEETEKAAAQFADEARKGADEVFKSAIVDNKVEDIDSAQRLGLWALNTLGEQAPNMAATMFGSYIAGTSLLATRLGATPAALIGSTAVGTGLETAATVQEQRKATGKINAPVAIVAGVTKGLLDSIVPTAMSVKLGIGRKSAEGLKSALTRAVENLGAGSVAKVAGTEGLTEGFQEAIDIAARKYVDENYDALGPEAASRILNATAAGAFMGGVTTSTLNAFTSPALPTGVPTDPPTDVPTDVPAATNIPKAGGPREFTPAEVGAGDLFSTGKGPWDFPTGKILSDVNTQLSEKKTPTKLPTHPSTLPLEGLLKGSGLWSRIRVAQFNVEAWARKYAQDHTHVARQNPNVPGLQEASVEIERFDLETKNEIARATETLTEWKSLGYEKAEDVGKYMFELEALQRARPPSYGVVDPKTEEVFHEFPDKKDAYKMKKFLKDQGQETSVRTIQAPAQKPTSKERSTIAEKFGLNEHQLKVAEKIEGDFIRVLDRIEEVQLNQFDRMVRREMAPLELSEAQQNGIIDSILAAVKQDDIKMYEVEELLRENGLLNEEIIQSRILEQLEKIKTEMADLRAGFYFPATRFGDYVLIAKNRTKTGGIGKAVHVENFESHAERNEAMAAMEKEFPQFVWQATKVPDSMKSFVGLPSGFLESVGSRLKLTKSQQIDFENITAEYLPARSFAQRLRQKKHVPGASKDAQRVYADYFNSFSRHISRLNHSDIIQDSIKKIGKLEGPGDFTRQRTIQDYMQWVYDERVMHPQNDYWQLSSLTFLWYLGWNASSAAVNLTQPFLYAWPHLGAVYGQGKATASLGRAYANLRKAYQTNSKLPEHLQWALDEAAASGPLKESLASDLVTAAESPLFHKTMHRAGVDNIFTTITQTGTWMFQKAEELNRYATFMASYDLARKAIEKGKLPKFVQEELQRHAPLITDIMEQQGRNYEDAAAYTLAVADTKLTMFDYSPTNRPKLSGGVGRIFLPFYNFIMKSLQFYSSSPGSKRALALMFLIAGYSGLPGAEDFMALAKLAARTVGKYFDPQKELRKLLKQAELDPDIETFFRRGAGSILPWDIGSRLSLGRIIPGFSELPSAMNEGATTDVIGRAANSASGAALQIPFNVIKAMREKHPSTLARLQTAAPTAVKNVIKGSRELTEGGVRNRNNDLIMRFDLTNPYDLSQVVGQFMGFNPQELRKKYETMNMGNDAIKYWMGRRTAILSAYASALKVDDDAGIEAAHDALIKYNEEAPHPAFIMRPREVLSSLKQRIKTGFKTEEGIPYQGLKFTPYVDEL